MEDDFSAILFCPVCCSTIDIEDAGPQEHECVTCGTKFSVNVDPEVVAQHAMQG